MSDNQNPPLVPPGPTLPTPDPTHAYLHGPPPQPPRPPVSGAQPNYPPPAPFPAYPAYQAYPGFQPYVPPPPRPRAVRGFGVAAIVAAAALLATQLAEAIAAWPSGRAYAEAWQRGEDADFTASWDVVGWTVVPAVVLAYVAGSWWLWRARSNVPALAPDARPGLARGWAWGGWVTPVVAFWFPVLVVRDTWRATISGAGRAGVLALWWTCWMLWLTSEIFTAEIVFDQAPGNTVLLGATETTDLLLCAVAFALWVRFVLRVTRTQTAWLDGATP